MPKSCGQRSIHVVPLFVRSVRYVHSIDSVPVSEICPLFKLVLVEEHVDSRVS